MRIKQRKMQIHEELRNRRTELKITLDELREKVGLDSVAHISMVERGKKIPSDKLLKLMCEALSLPYEELAEQLIEERDAVSFELDGLSPKVRQLSISLARKRDSISDTQAEEIRRILEG